MYYQNLEQTLKHHEIEIKIFYAITVRIKGQL
jgi:hypothetical protein